MTRSDAAGKRGPIANRLDEIVSLLRTLISAERPEPCRLLRLKDAACYMSVSPWKLRGLVQNGEIPVVKNGEGAAGVWLLDKQDLDQWISRMKTTL
jgi:excisionase family DNA binding protein